MLAYLKRVTKGLAGLALDNPFFGKRYLILFVDDILIFFCAYNYRKLLSISQIYQ
jgi:hypothetical protein